MYFSLPFPGHDRFSTVSLESMFEAYFQKELLAGENRIICEGCKEKKDSVKSLRITKPPNILIIHFKRFAFEQGLIVKLNRPVRFPIHDLDLTPYCAGSSNGLTHKYNLFGVVFHGGTCQGGHYTAATKETFSEKWIFYDDKYWGEFPTENLQKSEIRQQAYLLFYIKNDLKAFRRQTLSNFENRLTFMKIQSHAQYEADARAVKNVN